MPWRTSSSGMKKGGMWEWGTKNFRVDRSWMMSWLCNSFWQFRAREEFRAEQDMEEDLFFQPFEISFLWTFHWYITWSYSMDTHFLLVLDKSGSSTKAFAWVVWPKICTNWWMNTFEILVHLTLRIENSLKSLCNFMERFAVGILQVSN